jgi:hypothetical protein
MAITFVNAGVSAAVASGDITLAAPALPQTNDIWIAAIHSADQLTHAFTDWTPIFQANGGGTTSHLSVWFFRYAGSTPNLVVDTNSVGATVVGGIAAFRGCLTSGSPVNVVGTGSSGTDTSLEVLGVTPSVNDCMLVICDGTSDDNNRTVLPTSFTAAFSPGNNSYKSTIGTPDTSVALHYRIWISGATGDFVDTIGTSQNWASVLFALAPPPVVDVFFEQGSRLEQGMKPVTAAGMGGLLIH